MISVIILIIAIALLITMYFYYPCKTKETFQSMEQQPDELIQNGSFEEGKPIYNQVGSANGFNIITYPNPGPTSFVLKQEPNSSAQGYSINIPVENGGFYQLKYWYLEGKDQGSTLEGDEVVLKTYPKNNAVALDKLVMNTIDTKKDTLGNIWEYRQTMIQIPPNNTGNITIVLGSPPGIKQGYRMWTSVSLIRKSPLIGNLPVINGLSLYLDLMENKQLRDIIKDKSLSGTDLILNRQAKFDNDNLMLLKETKGQIPKANLFFNPTGFTMFWLYKANDFDEGRLFTLNSTNIDGKFHVFYKNNVGINNILEITYGRYRYTYDIGIAQRPGLYAVKLGRKGLELYLDGYLVPAKTQVNLIEQPTLGNCPDTWQYNGGGVCQTLGNNKGTCQPLLNFTGYDEERKRSWAQECQLSWTNCVQLRDNEVAPAGSANCTVNAEIILDGNPMLVNDEEKLDGALGNVLVYHRPLTEDEIIMTTRFIVHTFTKGKTVESEIEKQVFKVPDTVRDRGIGNQEDNFMSKQIDRTIKIVQDQMAKYTAPNMIPTTDCPFEPASRNNPDSPCMAPECVDADWKKNSFGRGGLEPRCKNVVDKYCENNMMDKECIKMRNMKADKALAHLKAINPTLKNDLEYRYSNSNAPGMKVPSLEQFTIDMENCRGCMGMTYQFQTN